MRIALVAGLIAVFGAGFGISRALTSGATEPTTPTTTLPLRTPSSATIDGVSPGHSIPALSRRPQATSTPGNAVDAGGTTTPGATKSGSQDGVIQSSG
jgi:hypothetical protein